MADAGLVLMDRSLRILGSDQGANSILGEIRSNVRQELSTWFPQEFLDSVRRADRADLASAIARFRIGATEYTCRATALTMNEASTTLPVIALCLEKAAAGTDSLEDVAERYNLTEREREVLVGVAKGLRTKELAASLSISPNTVKAFLRLVMIKMGAPSRAGIVSKIFQNAAAMERRSVRVEGREGKRLAS